MNNKNTGIIATVVAALLCGCPGLFLCLFGAISAAGAGTFDLNGQGGGIPPMVGVALVCVALILILIPVGVGFFTLRKKPAAAVPDSNESLPPAS